MVIESPHSYAIFTLIQSIENVPFTCTTEQKVELKEASEKMDYAIEHVNDEVTHVQSVHARKTIL